MKLRANCDWRREYDDDALRKTSTSHFNYPRVCVCCGRCTASSSSSSAAGAALRTCGARSLIIVLDFTPTVTPLDNNLLGRNKATNFIKEEIQQLKEVGSSRQHAHNDVQVR